MPGKRSALYPSGYGTYRGGVGTMDQAQGNVLLPAIGGGPTGPFGIDFSQAHTWAWMWGLVLPAAWLAFRYFMHGGRRGGIL